LACAAAAALFLVATPTSASATTTPVTGPTPNAPWLGNPGTGQVVWTEDFSASGQSADPVPLQSYVGASGEAYTAAVDWLPPAPDPNNTGACNGWVLTSASPNPNNGSDTDVSVDFGCSNDGGKDSGGNTHPAWWFLRQMADGLGAAQGITSGNAVVSSETNNNNPAIATTNQFTASLTAQAIPGHYYTASIWVAAVHCAGDQGEPTANVTWANVPNEQLALTVGGTAVATVNPSADDQVCGVNNPPVLQKDPVSGRSVDIHTAKIVIPPVLVTTAGPLGLTLDNLQAASNGNDSAFDTPTIIDVTPKLDKVIAPASILPGGTATLTLTITNAFSDAQATTPSVLEAKQGLSFTDTLPTNVTVASTQPANTGTCASVQGMTVTAAAGSGSVTVAGDLGAGTDNKSCTVIVNVTATKDGVYTNGPDKGDFGTATGGGYSALTGLWPPADATLTVTSKPGISLAKTADPTTASAVNQIITYTFVITNTGNVPLTQVTLDDPDYIFNVDPTTGNPLTCTPAFSNDGTDTLAVGAVVTCTATHTVTAADLAAGTLVNTATATGYDPASGTTVSSDSSASVNMYTPPPPPPPSNPSAVTGGSVNAAMVLWPMLALMVAGGAVWLYSWRRKLAA